MDLGGSGGLLASGAATTGALLAVAALRSVDRAGFLLEFIAIAPIVGAAGMPKVAAGALGLGGEANAPPIA